MVSDGYGPSCMGSPATEWSPTNPLYLVGVDGRQTTRTPLLFPSSAPTTWTRIPMPLGSPDGRLVAGGSDFIPDSDDGHTESVVWTGSPPSEREHQGRACLPVGLRAYPLAG